MEERTYLPEVHWQTFKPHMEALAHFGRKTNLRLFLEAVLWLLRTGCPWRDLHPRFGSWNKVYRRFRRWAISGRWTTLQQRMQRELSDYSTLLVDSTAVGAHGHAAGAAGGQPQGLGRSRLKQFRRLATRYDKTMASFAGSVQLAAAFIAVTGWP